MITLYNINFHIPKSSEPPWIEFNEALAYTNHKTKKQWVFKAGFTSDGATRPKLIRAFDRFIMAHLAHDQDCVNALTWKQWQRGNDDYFDNLREQGMPYFRAAYHWGLVSSNSVFKKVKGELK